MTRRPPLGYQPALDGLRAVAVVGVLLYHSGLSWAKGGFLGVDVFFALSGFLITSLLLQEYDRWSHLDLLAFWGRRARRLLPAMFLVVIAVAVYAKVYVDEASQSGLRGDSISSLLYVANWQFVLQGSSYFDQYVAPSPLKHTWSLAIEEQFYLVFPLVLLILLAWLGRRWLRLALVLLGGAVLSAWLMAALFVPGEDPSRVYYGTDTRVQTLLVGAALAAALPWLAERRAVRAVAPALSVVSGIAVIGALVWLSDSDSRLYRGGFLLVAVVSTVLIGSVVIGRGPVRWLLERRAMVRVGVISYGVYLWHWPIFVWLTPDRTHLSAPALLALRFLVTFVVAAVSYEFVEQPIRSGSFARLTAGTRVRTGVAALVATVLVVVAGTAGAVGATATTASGTSTAIVPGATSDVSAMLYGDSVPLGLTEKFDRASAPGLAVGGTFRLGCGLTSDSRVIDGAVVPLPAQCAPWAAGVPAEVLQARPQTLAVFLGIYEQFDHEVDGRTLTFGTPAYAAYLSGILDRLRAAVAPSGARIALVNSPCRDILDLGTSPDSHISNDPQRIAWLNDWAREYTGDPTHATTLVDLYGYLCSRGYVNEMDGVTLRDDGLHFTQEGAKVVWRFLGPKLRAVAGAPQGPQPSTTAPSSPQPAASADASLTTFILGDSNAFDLRSNYPADVAPGFQVTGSTQLGCGLFPQTLWAEGKRIPPIPQCADWKARRAGEVATVKPDLGVLVAGSWEQYDREVDGKVLVAGTKAWTDDLAARFAAELTSLSASSKHVAFVNDHCHLTPDLGLGPEPHIVNDDKRVADVNVAVKQAITMVGFPVTLVDMNDFLCRDGYSNTRNGVTLRQDGLHFTPEGARIVWAWLGPQLRAATQS